MAANSTPVTRAELAQHIVSIDEKLEKVPSRWEVRTLILVGIIGAQLVPAGDIARAAVQILPF